MEASALGTGATDAADVAGLGCGSCTGKLSMAGVSKLTACMLLCTTGTDQPISTEVVGANGSSRDAGGAGCMGLVVEAHMILDCGMTGADAGPIFAN